MFKPLFSSIIMLGLFAGTVNNSYAQSNSDPEFSACLARLKPAAQAQNITADTFNRYVSTIIPEKNILELLNNQPEFSTPIWDYMASLVDTRRVNDGKRLFTQYNVLLNEISQKYGVDPATIVAVWGVESDYGRSFGKRPLLNSLTTLSCFGRRQTFFQGQLFSTLKLLQRGDIDATNLVGSWAGAFGHTQFMPSTYMEVAVDGDGDGRRDLVASIPDALASTANYLKRSGWKTGQPWGYEIQLPKGFNANLAGRTKRQPLSSWVNLGIKKIDGSPITASEVSSAVLLPAGQSGPAFLVFKNYDAIYSYNAAESYALAISLLSDRIKGKSGLVTPWPTDDLGLGRDERVELQELLIQRGHPLKEADGFIGKDSREAIQKEQQRLNLPVNGRASQKILNALKK